MPAGRPPALHRAHGPQTFLRLLTLTDPRSASPCAQLDGLLCIFDLMAGDLLFVLLPKREAVSVSRPGTPRKAAPGLPAPTDQPRLLRAPTAGDLQGLIQVHGFEVRFQLLLARSRAPGAHNRA